MNTIGTSSKFDPNEGIEYVPYPRQLVEAIDALIRYKRELGVGDSVSSNKDWRVLLKTFDVWRVIYPEDYNAFFKSQKEYWATLKNEYGVHQERGGAVIRKHAEIPQKLFRMIEIMFPKQQWDKKFLVGLARRLPILKGYKKS